MLTVAASPTNESPELNNRASSMRYYRPELDALRFFAFLSVFIFHVLPPNADYYTTRHLPFASLISTAARAGSFGVDLFFVLSAFLITELLLREKDQFKTVHLKSFYVRRILRIWPLYFFAITLGALLPLLDPTQSFSTKYIAAFVLLCGNWLVAYCGFPGSVMNPLWSVSFEEQFYLLWPSAVSRFEKRTLLWVASAMIVFAEVARLTVLGLGRSEVAIQTSTITRLDPLAVGIITAVILHDRSMNLNKMTRAALLAAGIGLWLLAGHTFAMTRSFMLFGYPAIAAGAWFIVLAVLGVSKVPRFLTYLGKISYGLYVFHLLALFLTEKALGSYAHSFPKFAANMVVGFSTTVGLSALSYRVLESPFLRLKERFALVKTRPV